MDISALFDLIPANVAQVVLTVAAFLSLLLPALEWIVKKTTFTWDDRVYNVLVTVLGLIPRARFGTGVTTKLADPAAKEALKPAPIGTFSAPKVSKDL